MKFTIEAKTPEAMAKLARAIGTSLTSGDTLLLAGPIGVGKSHFARALIQHRLQALGRVEDVPSPSFTLVQTYDLDTATLWHIDLYRLQKTYEVAELGLEEAFAKSICLVEWPERLGADRPERYVEINFSIPDLHRETRHVSVTLRGGEWDTIASALKMSSSSGKGWTNLDPAV